MTPQEAQNNIDCRFLNNVGRQLLYLDEWNVVKSEIQRLRRIEDSVKMMGVGNERSKERGREEAKPEKFNEQRT